MSEEVASAAGGTADESNYLVVSTDGHCGGDVWDYKPYLAQRYHDEFDQWARTYHDPWSDFDPAFPADARVGPASFAAPLNWEGPQRLAYTESQSIAAEVLFPNTAPPFFPSGMISAPGPRTPEEYEYRFAGLQAHNRWLADFCGQTPGRRAGMAQIFLDDVDDAMAEVRRAKEGGLMGILLPGDHVLKLANLYYPAYDPLWALCVELQLPVHRHGMKATEAADVGGAGAAWVGSVESPFYALRGIAHMICGGVFERFPDLQFVTTEPTNGADIPPLLARLDRMWEAATPGSFLATNLGNAAQDLRRRPSEYFATNCHVGNPLDFRAALAAGTPCMMWGADLPHAEGSSPFTHEALRCTFSDLPTDVVRRFVGLDAIDLYGFDRDHLQRVADKIGPSPKEIAQPLPVQEWPNYPGDTRCLTFSTDNQMFSTAPAMA